MEKWRWGVGLRGGKAFGQQAQSARKCERCNLVNWKVRCYLSFSLPPLKVGCNRTPPIFSSYSTILSSSWEKKKQKHFLKLRNAPPPLLLGQSKRKPLPLWSSVDTHWLQRSSLGRGRRCSPRSPSAPTRRPFKTAKRRWNRGLQHTGHQKNGHGEGHSLCELKARTIVTPFSSTFLIPQRLRPLKANIRSCEFYFWRISESDLAWSRS